MEAEDEECRSLDSVDESTGEWKTEQFFQDDLGAGESSLSAVSDSQQDDGQTTTTTTTTTPKQPSEEMTSEANSGQERDENEPGTSSQSPKTAPRSSWTKVQFDAGTKEMDGGLAGAKKKVRRSFKDIVLEQVINADHEELAAAGAGTTPKSILKVRSEPALARSGKSLSYINKAYEGDSDNSNNIGHGKKSPSPFLKRLGGKASGEGHGFADVVDLLIQRTSLDSGGRDVHPFGRDCSIEGIMQASRPKSHSKNSAFGKLVVWMTLLSFLLGAACGVIFLSERYNASQRADKLLKATMNSSLT